MSYIDDIEIYNDSIIARKRKGTSTDPFKEITETLTVINGKALLTEIPNPRDRVMVKTTEEFSLTEIEDGELTSNLFTVDYPNGIVYLHENWSNQPLTFSYLGEGAKFFPDSRIWVQNDNGNKILTAKDKFKDIDRLILEQKNRVDEQIQSVPQPSETVDTRIDRNGTIFPVAKDRIDSEQKKIEDAYEDLNGDIFPSLKDRIDSEQQKIEEAYLDNSGYYYVSLKHRLGAVDSRLETFEENIESIEGQLTLKVDDDDFNGENLVSMIELTPGEIKISADKINMTGKVAINDLNPEAYDKLNNAASKLNLNLTGALPTSIVLDTNGVTAYTSDISKYARLYSGGLHIKGGAVSMERPDGYLAIDNGIQKNDFAITGCTPPYKDDQVEIVSKYYRMTGNVERNLDFFTFRHDARYLVITVGVFTGTAGVASTIRVYPTGGGDMLASFSTTESSSTSDAALYGRNIVVDLGTPTGDMTSVYVRMLSGSSTGVAHGRIIKMWKEG